MATPARSRRFRRYRRHLTDFGDKSPIPGRTTLPPHLIGVGTLGFLTCRRHRRHFRPWFIKAVVELAEDIWDLYGFDFGTGCSGLFKTLSHANFNVRLAASKALAAVLSKYPDLIEESLSTLFSLHISDTDSGENNVDPCFLVRQGIALALDAPANADVFRTNDLHGVMTFLISQALASPNTDVHGRMINAGIRIIDEHGRENVSLLFPMFDFFYFASDEEKNALVQEGVVIFFGASAKHLAKDDPKIHTVVDKLLDVLKSSSNETVQRAVSTVLSPLMPSKQDDAPALVSRLLDQLMKSEKNREQRGAAFGLAGVVKGFGIKSLKKYEIVSVLRTSLADRISAKFREGALLGFEYLCETLGKLFEPYAVQMLPWISESFLDEVVEVRVAAKRVARAMMSQLSAHGVKLVLPFLLKGLEDKAWRKRECSVQLLGAMAYCAPQQLSQCLPKIVPKLTKVLTDTHPEVRLAAKTTLDSLLPSKSLVTDIIKAHRVRPQGDC